MTQDIKAAIQRRIDHNRLHGVGFIEGQLLPRGITLEVACELAEYRLHGMTDEAIALIETLPQREIIGRIYNACAGIKS